MRRIVLLLALAAIGCAKKPTETSVVKLPEGLARPGEAKPTPGEPPASPPKAEEPAKPEAVSVAAKPETTPQTIVAHTTPRRATPPAAERMSGLPPMPKADETHPLGYRIPEGAVEVEGVCKFTEDDVACWDGKGKSAASLAASIRAALTPSGNDTYRGNLNIRFGRKNRIVVLRHEQMPMGGQASTVQRSLGVGQVGDDPSQGYGGSISLPSESPDFQAKKPFVTHDARLVAVDPAARETKVRITVSESIPEPPELPLAKGSSVTFAGVRFTVTSIEKGVPRDGTVFYGGPDRRDMWTVTVAQEGQPTRPATFNVYSGEPLYRDAQGRIVPRETYEKWMREAQAKGGFIDYAKAPYRQVQIMGMSRGPGALRVTMDADPAQVKRMRLYGSYQRTVDVTGIPLDPR